MKKKRQKNDRLDCDLLRRVDQLSGLGHAIARACQEKMGRQIDCTAALMLLAKPAMATRVASTIHKHACRQMTHINILPVDASHLRVQSGGNDETPKTLEDYDIIRDAEVMGHSVWVPRIGMSACIAFQILNSTLLGGNVRHATLRELLSLRRSKPKMNELKNLKWIFALAHRKLHTRSELFIGLQQERVLRTYQPNDPMVSRRFGFLMTHES